MNLRCYMIFFLLSFSWLLSFQENHICIDSFSASLDSDSSEHEPPRTLGSEPSSDSEHEKEMCHFGHCSHGIRVTFLSISLPLEIGSPFYFIPYNSKALPASVRLSLRPPALA
jgi:hypothetical protein